MSSPLPAAARNRFYGGCSCCIITDTLAHHELHQLHHSPDVESAVMSNPATRIVFHVSDDDAKKLAEGFSFFEAQDLQNLGKGKAICRIERKR